MYILLYYLGTWPLYPKPALNPKTLNPKASNLTTLNPKTLNLKTLNPTTQNPKILNSKETNAVLRPLIGYESGLLP